MDKYEVWLELIQFRIPENSILIILVILGLIELGPDPVVQQEKLQYELDIACGRSSEDRDPFIDIPYPLPRQKLSSDRLLLAKDIIGIVRIFKLFHPVPPNLIIPLVLS